MDVRLRRISLSLLALLATAALGSLGQDVDKLAEVKAPVAFDAKILENLYTRNIGPANMGGRIVSIDGVEKDKIKTVYAAPATGGIWRTDNDGVTWKQVFDATGNHSMGCVAVCRDNPDVVWAGSGEINPRNSVTFGLGVYKSTDGAKTWTHMGLADTHHVSQICIHPTNPEVVYVAALGHLWAPNKERGVYKTEDGGKTWNLIKFIDNDTGFIDLVMDPNDPDTLYGGAWAVRRGAVAPAWSCLSDVGPNGGIFKTTDGGKTWKKLLNGLPNRPTGRIGLHIHRKDPRILYAVLATDLTKSGIAGQAASRGGDPGPVDGGGLFRSEDKGESWTKVNAVCQRPFYFTTVRVDPEDDQRVYYLGLHVQISTNGGKSFAKGGGGHPDMHAMWIDPRDPNRVFLGNDGGIYHSANRGENWSRLNNVAIGQFYHCDVDMSSPYRIYGGLQDNSCWGGPSQSRYTNGVVNADWKVLGGGPAWSDDDVPAKKEPRPKKSVYQQVCQATVLIQRGSSEGTGWLADLREAAGGFVRSLAAPQYVRSDSADRRCGTAQPIQPTRLESSRSGPRLCALSDSSPRSSQVR